MLLGVLPSIKPSDPDAEIEEKNQTGMFYFIFFYYVYYVHFQIYFWFFLFVIEEKFEKIFQPFINFVARTVFDYYYFFLILYV